MERLRAKSDLKRSGRLSIIVAPNYWRLFDFWFSSFRASLYEVGVNPDGHLYWFPLFFHTARRAEGLQGDLIDSFINKGANPPLEPEIYNIVTPARLPKEPTSLFSGNKQRIHKKYLRPKS